MNASQIKTSISISDYLSSIGLEPAHKNGNQWLYHSPLHRDNKPSFSVNTQKDVWNDFSAGQGGDIITLVKLLHHTDTSGAIAALSGTSDSKPVFSFHQQNSSCTEAAKITVLHLQPIRNNALIEYLNFRQIPLHIARKYLAEAYFTTDQIKRFFALAFRNDQEGFALRNKFWKGASSPAYFTTIPGKWNDQVNVFEGFFDFLSALAYYKIESLKRDCIVLNSTSHLNSALPTLEHYPRINLFFDNDPAGIQAAEKIRTCNKNVVDYSEIIYPGNKDFNEFLTSKRNP